MATWIARAKQIVANVKSKGQIVPGTAFLRVISAAFAHVYRPKWESFLDSDEQTVISVPAGSVLRVRDGDDAMDIGVENAGGVFTAARQPEKDSLSAIHMIRIVRGFTSDVLTQYRLETRQIAVQDAGDTAGRFRASVMAAARIESKTELGDPTNDPDA